MNNRTHTELLSLFSGHYASSPATVTFWREHKPYPKYFSLSKKQLGFTPPSVRLNPVIALVFARVLLATQAHAIILQW
ncbi:hypothetical protein [Microbulbifer spongiae]|uniref:Uncharacterized protein n=1 Tax=Microbulbifer spongiae TaxID=2944933 RepID=A0ABY9ECK7_9GAMM|nr:hypothetical protein [Microbulbifer sp. MI-G]WKD50185.1 hypothetical protein M8T91_01775 [Microbulbifer sp. MI-G]